METCTAYCIRLCFYTRSIKFWASSCKHQMLPLFYSESQSTSCNKWNVLNLTYFQVLLRIFFDPYTSRTTLHMSWPTAPALAHTRMTAILNQLPQQQQQKKQQCLRFFYWWQCCGCHIFTNNHYLFQFWNLLIN